MDFQPVRRQCDSIKIANWYLLMCISVNIEAHGDKTSKPTPFQYILIYNGSEFRMIWLTEQIKYIFFWAYQLEAYYKWPIFFQTGICNEFAVRQFSILVAGTNDVPCISYIDGKFRGIPAARAPFQHKCGLYENGFSHYKNKTLVSQFYLYNANPCSGKTLSWHIEPAPDLQHIIVVFLNCDLAKWSLRLVAPLIVQP